MKSKSFERKIVIVNQASNYLTVGFCNAFNEKFEKVVLITGSVHIQGELLDEDIDVDYINKWSAEHSGKEKLISYLAAILKIYFKILFKYRRFEVFFVSLPPMGYLLNLFLPNRFSMVIWDVFPDALKVTGMEGSNVIYRLWSWLNKRSFRKAFKLFTIGERMADLLSQYVNREKIIIQPIWSIFQENERINKEDNPFIQKHNLENKFIVQYSGSIGRIHKVELMVRLAEQMIQYDNILFQIIGRGPRKPYLERLVEQKKLPNCQFLPFQSDEMFPFSLSAADIGVVILNEVTSKGSVPSKSYNLMSYGIPSLYIASSNSELNIYAKKYNHGRCFTEVELDKAVDFILKSYSDKEFYLKLSHNSEAAARNFRRENADKFVKHYLNKRN